MREDRKREKELERQRVDEILASEESRNKWLLSLYERRRDIILQQEARLKLKDE